MTDKNRSHLFQTSLFDGQESVGNFCQDFSKIFALSKRFDRKSRGEIFKISPLNLQDFSLKFAGKPTLIYKPLISKDL
jgi:hypothetical protein